MPRKVLVSNLSEEGGRGLQKAKETKKSISDVRNADVTLETALETTSVPRRRLHQRPLTSKAGSVVPSPNPDHIEQAVFLLFESLLGRKSFSVRRDMSFPFVATVLLFLFMPCCGQHQLRRIRSRCSEIAIQLPLGHFRLR